MTCLYFGIFINLTISALAFSLFELYWEYHKNGTPNILKVNVLKWINFVTQCSNAFTDR